MKIIHIFSLLLLLCTITCCHSSSFNVQSYGAAAGGETDSSEAFLAAWAAACAHPGGSADVYVPPGRYVLGSVVFDGGHCKNGAVTFRMDGAVLAAPADYHAIASNQSWIQFFTVTGVTVVGGTLDGRGAKLWACKSSRKKNCPEGTTTLAFYHSSHIGIRGLTSQNSQKFHILVYGSDNVEFRDVTVSAPDNSPNTDGIHVQLSSNVNIYDSTIGTGDDCISIGPGSSNLWIQNITCGPGHGISIGSLGWEMEEQGVKNVTVSGATLRDTTNGFRIKTWSKPSHGFVSNIVFEHGVMHDVQNPIIIDQNYCPTGSCTRQGSGVKISDVSYQDIRGTTSNNVGASLDCSAKQPCVGIKLNDVNLTSKDGEAPKSSCANAHVTAFHSTVKSSSCASTPSSTRKLKQS
ncbi:unnamed protein product [Cuscuta campestris]|uniref:Pectate lyase superfamily protein domain-containing protein n=1 Tax=Cuscuta campestris TaxID=132261 RepID=A0A484MP06_9ASTE|nr:unnamed protein product [Cuscuta campestris]